MVDTASSKSQRTRMRLLTTALELFERDGYEETTTARIAAAAGVSEMTLFRHFAAKERLLGDDPYDPVIADAVAGQPSSLAPLARVTAGIRVAWESVPGQEIDEVRRRLRIAARTPSLVGVMRGNTRATEDAIAAVLVGGGTDRAAARIVSAAVLAALMEALLDWAAQEAGSLDEAIRHALDLLDGRVG